MKTINIKDQNLLKNSWIFIKSVLILLISTVSVIAQPTQPAASFILIDVKVFNGLGDVIENGAVGVKDGKIDYVGTTAKAPLSNYREVISKKDTHLYPGFIALNTTLGLTEIDAVRATRDFSETGDLNPNVRAISAYNAESEIVQTVLANGILFAQITPRGGTIKGSSSVVKLKGHNWEDAAYHTDEGIVMKWPTMYKPKDKKDDRQGFTTDKKYEQELEAITSFFKSAHAYSQKQIPVERDLRFEAMRGVFDGSKRLYISADFIKEIREIISFKRKYEIPKVSIIGGYDSWMAADLLKENDVSVIVGRVNALPHYAEDRVDAAYSLASKLATAGVKFSFTMEGDMETMQNRNLLFNIGTAIGYGLNKQTAITAASLHAAQILGIEDQTGSIEVGKEANFIITSGDVFEIMTSRVKEIYLKGVGTPFNTRQEDLYKKYNQN